jgi:DNA segregation ATPase FtsK/SpoIIIE-like protein
MKEMEAAEWALSADDVKPVLGASAAYIWTKQIKAQDFEDLVRDYTYRVEAGSARKPNKVNRVRQLNEFAQIAMPQLQQFAAQGNMEPYNAFITDWAKANDLDPSRYLVNPEQGQDEQQAAMQQQQMQMQQQQMQMQQQAQQAQQQQEAQKQQTEMQLKQLDMQAKQLDIQAKQVDLESSKQHLEIDKQKNQMELDFMKQKHEIQIKEKKDA